MRKWAKIDQTKRYRYLLGREWESNNRRVTFVMLNPSTADEEKDDKTLSRCIGFARAWGYGSLEVVNLFGYRATNPVDLLDVKDPVGPENDSYLLEAIERANKIIVAWGKDGNWRRRDQKVLQLIPEQVSLYCLGLTETGQPRHPLLITNSRKPVLYPKPPIQLELDLGI